VVVERGHEVEQGAGGMMEAVMRRRRLFRKILLRRRRGKKENRGGNVTRFERRGDGSARRREGSCVCGRECARPPIPMN